MPSSEIYNHAFLGIIYYKNILYSNFFNFIVYLKALAYKSDYIPLCFRITAPSGLTGPARA